MKLKKLFHWHKYTTLFIYPPHNQQCDLIQCQSSAEYGFLLQCACGYKKIPKLFNRVTKVFNVSMQVQHSSVA